MSSAEKRGRVAAVERTVAGDFRYELVGEDGEQFGDLTSEEASWEIGDLVPCSGHMFEIRAIENATLRVLSAHEAALVLTDDGHGLPRIELTAGFTYVRLRRDEALGLIEVT